MKKYETENPVLMKSVRFTLVELLICIVILIILAALLFPALVKARAHAKQTICAGNFKQQQIALATYLATFADMFPAVVDRYDDKTGSPILNGARWYGYHLWLMEDSIPKKNLIYPNMKAYSFNPKRDPMYSGDRERGKGIPEEWICPARYDSLNELQIVSNNYYEIWVHRFGLVEMQNNFRAGIKPENSPLGGPVGRMPDSARYSYMAETGWEPTVEGKKEYFLKFKDTRHIYAPEKQYGNLDGTRPFGHVNGFNVVFLDGHVTFLPSKRKSGSSRIKYKNKGVMGFYETRLVDDSDM